MRHSLRNHHVITTVLSLTMTLTLSHGCKVRRKNPQNTHTYTLILNALTLRPFRMTKTRTKYLCYNRQGMENILNQNAYPCFGFQPFLLHRELIASSVRTCPSDTIPHARKFIDFLFWIPSSEWGAGKKETNYKILVFENHSNRPV